ncbi:uncharacterized protein PITG_17381 [Phytophthora infestans T30-4]|uniref:Uncharacterized protein n=1 Tax=Phytophthora infestans (strain T30-4) TaxID=403677 RepID=D0NVX8_PHYIT|nr:uncharacterized protein PITG_17381 [Phytophthora infestans T30-4]EEY66814.1 conserved hypothetical protein [Phytophthora infestans T30-4]KAI9980524.1 hypothetical protein PInf_030161 [Phytophthora infestans]|eukprot:XP_002896701.1 conserved hypothetical protein [Phytophthora infestans T30-4]
MPTLVVTLETGEIRTMTGRTSLNLILGGFTFSSRGRSASAVSGTDGSPGAGRSTEVGRGGDDAPRDGEDGVVASANENQDVDLKTVKAEVRWQAVTVGTKWRDDQLYHEVASHLDGESKRWFATVIKSVSPEEENIDPYAELLRAMYMTQHTDPEVVVRQEADEGRGLGGGDARATAQARPLGEAVSLATPHVGDYGEGYGVGSRRRWCAGTSVRRGKGGALDSVGRER